MPGSGRSILWHVRFEEKVLEGIDQVDGRMVDRDTFM